jgi:hypothetical protein
VARSRRPRTRASRLDLLPRIRSRHPLGHRPHLPERSSPHPPAQHPPRPRRHSRPGRPLPPRCHRSHLLRRPPPRCRRSRKPDPAPDRPAHLNATHALQIQPKNNLQKVGVFFPPNLMTVR